MSDQPDLSDLQSSGQLDSVPSETLPVGWNYEATVAEIEAIIDRIERGELDLADMFDQFSIAVERLRQCESFLARQQQQVDLLVETLLDEPDLF
ncbi:exodeoxyribonuclease VII small subunit [Thermocoleostomius sinensis]|jgi:exodeoxyribonuclease VII small subunit|uniref:Exodeoxyribonuclease 7 small subunit n=1 Tax=Thermocoleostomius sinensis A174 TaxID=2016057 RepID=A0A9E8ZHY2_9CYAN|nr:exodeoxyribonuclease VII small subunit [Thermocoleostomius sinensis]WAL61613.1 exodeoxyribonuclease VII small subunit [Thermocoleostomius sinensis A174]